MRTLAVMSCVLVLVAAAGAQDDANKKELEKLQGTWSVVRVERGGKERDPKESKDMKIVFKADKLIIQAPGKEMELTIKIDATKKPKTIDWKQGDQTLLGIYELQGDTLRICGSPDERPTEFATKADTKIGLIVLKRDKGQ